jgi:hypothetical protein
MNAERQRRGDYSGVADALAREATTFGAADFGDALAVFFGADLAEPLDAVACDLEVRRLRAL